MNVIVTAIGSMSAECVVESLTSLGINVIATDIYPKEFHPILRRCVAFTKVIRADEDPVTYCSSLLDCAMKYKCSAIIPLTDPEVDILSKRRLLFDRLANLVWLPADELVKIIRNKAKWAYRLRGAKEFSVIPTYATFDQLKVDYQGEFVAKKIEGRSSEGIIISSTGKWFGEQFSSGYLFQPYLDGDIITVDFIKHPTSGRVVLLPRRECMRTVNGAGTVVEILDPECFRPAIVELINSLNIVGYGMNCEFIKCNGELYLMDINPRFSAGVSFSKMAGYDFVKAHVACYMQDDIPAINQVLVGHIFVKRYRDFS